MNNLSTERKRGGTAEDVCRRVKTIFSDRLGIREDQIELACSLREDLDADSADWVELIFALAQEFGCDLFDEDVGIVQTVGDMVAYIEQRYSLSEFPRQLT